MLALEIIDDFQRLLDIKDEWLSFARTISTLTPFQLPQWLITWWSHFGSGRLHVMVFRKHGPMAAIIPCFLHEWKGRRQLTLIGSGISDYLDPAISPECCEEVLALLAEYLPSNLEWAVCDWQDLSDNTPLRQIQSRDRLHITVQEETPCAQIPLVGSFEEFWLERPNEMRKNLRRDMKRAGNFEFAAQTKSGRELLDSLIQLHSARWEKRGERGTIAANGSEKFLRDVVSEFDHLGILQFFALNFGERSAAVILGFVYANKFFFYLSGLEPEFEAFSPGGLLLAKSVAYCFEKKYTAWDFLRGSEHYKFRWGAQRISKCRITIVHAIAQQTS